MAGKDDYDELDDLLNRDDTGAKAENKNTIKNRKKKERKKRNKKNNKNNGDQDKKINFDIFDDEFMEAMQKAMSKINTMNFSDDDEKDLELKSKAFMDETITSLQSKYSWYEECIYVRGRLANWIYKNPDSDMLEDRKKQLKIFDTKIAIYEKDDYIDEKYGPQLLQLATELKKIPNSFHLEEEDALNESPASKPHQHHGHDHHHDHHHGHDHHQHGLPQTRVPDDPYASPNCCSCGEHHGPIEPKFNNPQEMEEFAKQFCKKSIMYKTSGKYRELLLQWIKEHQDKAPAKLLESRKQEAQIYDDFIKIYERSDYTDEKYCLEAYLKLEETKKLYEPHPLPNPRTNNEVVKKLMEVFQIAGDDPKSQLDILKVVEESIRR